MGQEPWNALRYHEKLGHDSHASQNVDQCFHIGLARHLLAVDGVLNLLLLIQQICDFLKQSSHGVGLEGPGCRLNNQ